MIMHRTSGSYGLLACACIISIAIALPVQPAHGQYDTEESARLEALRQALRTDISRLPERAAPGIYEAQFALTIDRFLGAGTGAGAGADASAASGASPVSNRACLMILEALGEALVSAPNANVRTALMNMRGNLDLCRGGTGAGPDAAGGILFDLPQPQTGGGSDYVQ
ncbi:hypothetical protein I5E68_13495 [Novosphingobium sp. YJ-S2-02]|uniref:Uncharacterized protein n=1 Tax=Novosphingobium aureum TaxID=2792964 RepID=A0A931HDG7_9SPHN|nr:hypothetical protein [Novosphingobium aureum]MBH0113956.1 hypothetical protein [Novosphingobium aureum]